MMILSQNCRILTPMQEDLFVTSSHHSFSSWRLLAPRNQYFLFDSIWFAFRLPTFSSCFSYHLTNIELNLLSEARLSTNFAWLNATSFGTVYSKRSISNLASACRTVETHVNTSMNSRSCQKNWVSTQLTFFHGIYIFNIGLVCVPVEEMINSPFETRSDSFYFVDDCLIMHNKADYAYNGGISKEHHSKWQ